MEPKTFRRREHRTRATRTAVDHFTGPVLEQLRERMRAVDFEGDVSPECFVQLQETLTRFVETSLEHLDSVVAERHETRTAAPELRSRRDEQARELYSTLVTLRQTVGGVFGRTMERELFGAGKTPRDPYTLVRLGNALSNKLSTSDVRERLTGPRRVSFDWGETALDVAEQTKYLEETLQELTRNASRQSTAVSRKDEAAREHDRTQRGMFKVLEGLYEMAGMDPLAEKLRPTEPTRRKTEDSDSETTEAQAATEPLDDTTPPLQRATSGSQPLQTRPESLTSASLEGWRDSPPPGAAPHPVRTSSDPPGAASHPVRTGSDPPGGASHPGWSGSESAGDEIPRV